MAPGDAKPVFYLIPHTHWEGAVFQTREAYLDIGLPIILRALALLKAEPTYRFTLDQMCYVKPFLERYPEHAEAFQRLVRERRLAIVGGTDTMLDVNMPGGESFVRQVLLGTRFFRESLGVDVTIAWQLDTFGHHAQMPQLLRLAGLESFWFFRGVPNWETPSEFLWEGLDGSTIPAYWLPHGYAMSYGSPATPDAFAEFVEQRFVTLDGFSCDAVRVGPGGADVCEPESHLPAMVEAYNARPDARLELRLATPRDYEQAVQDHIAPPVLRCELNPIFQGIYSSRIELKQRTRELEFTLARAEALGAMLQWLGERTDDATLERAWEPMLFNQAHDLMSGVMTDTVYEDTLRGFDFSKRLADEEADDRLRRYVSRVDTRGEGTALLVYNPLSWERTDAAHVTIGFSDLGVTGVRIVSPDGFEAPCQILSAERNADGSLSQIEVVFVARDVPSLGHAVYRAIPMRDDAYAGPKTTTEATPRLSNGRLSLTVDATTGAIVELSLAEDGWQALAAPANIVVREEDRGDLWEPYRPLDGGSRIAMTDPHPIPPRGRALFSDEQPAEVGAFVTGPVMSEVTVEHPLGESGLFATRIRLYAGLPRIDIRTRTINDERFVRYRAQFPTSLSGTTTQEVPFGAIERPAGIEFPAQNWADLSDGEHGLLLLNRGLPGNATSDGALLLSLLRSTCIVAYGYGGGYGPGMSSDSGFELGRELVFDYALVPHKGDWRAAEAHRRGLEFNSPLLAMTAASHAGPLPPTRGLVRISHPGVVVSAVKCNPDGAVVLRLYEALGRRAEAVRLEFAHPIVRARTADLLERSIDEVSVAGGAIELNLRPFEVRTLLLEA